MRPAILLAATLLTCAPHLAGCATLLELTGAGEAVAPKIEEMNERFEQRFRSGDMLGIADIYADDGLLLAADVRIEGREAIDAYWSRVVDPIDLRLEIFEIGGSQDLAYQRGRSFFTVRRRTGVEHTSIVNFMQIWKKDAEGAWKISIEATW